jgi:hypothetical protein
MPEKDCPKTSTDFGHFYEDIVKKRSLQNIEGLQSIYDPGIFNKSGKDIKAIKAFIIKGNSSIELKNNFKESVKQNEFIIFPNLNYSYEFSVDGIFYELEIKDYKINVYRYDAEKKTKVLQNSFLKKIKNILSIKMINISLGTLI